MSISLAASDLVILRRRARARHAGNLSAVVAEAAQLVREQEGREALVRWLGDAGRTTHAEHEAILAQLLSEPPRRRRRKHAA